MNDRYNWFGIDFGTTNSAAVSLTGINESNLETLYYGDDEGRPFPSVVAIDKETGAVITGREAKDRRNSLLETHEYISSIKTYLGTDKTWTIAGKIWTPEDIAAEILKALKAKALSRNNSLDEAVVAVPIGYTASKKSALRKAASKAGIDIKMFISEPTAAFCSNYNELRSCKNIVVFDWGGGTLDVVALRVDNGNVSELSADGINEAGNSIDITLAERMHAIFMRKKEISVPFEQLDAVTKDQLISKCEKAKCDFEDEDVVVITINKYDRYGSVREAIEYDYFSLLIEPFINKAMSCLENVIKKSGLNKENIDKILCVGGSSKLRVLQERLEQEYGEDTVYYPNRVMWNIAEGASITSTRNGGYTLSKSVGLQLSDGTYFPLIKKGQRIPCEELKINFGTIDNSDACFVFTDSEEPESRELYENVFVPIYNMADEYLTLQCYVDNNNVFKTKIGSNRISETRAVNWKYENLKVAFQVEDTEE